MKSNKKLRLYIKSMVCPRCIQSVHEQAMKAGLQVKMVKLGELSLTEAYTEEQLNRFIEGIEGNGFGLITDKRSRLVESVKTEILNVIQYEKKIPGNQNFSTYLASTLKKDYSYLSGLFSRIEKTTIEKYIILQKIEKTKELLVYDELRLGEIAEKLGYSNTQHLSAQFKKITGLSPSQYKNADEKDRKPIDQLISCKIKKG
ncbi:helix-turn-helix domain-containing protein [Gaoshiqia sp. Z1-71]|uniref:helix-turn-helix domain-containing protein n=1 Tax=Gaoshiqia hydrogeniformans TaxID=3290090 RepID=UPI003BF78D97